MDYNCVGIGKVVLSSLDNESYNIPHLHFIVCKSNGLYEAVSLEFGLVASDEDAETAIENLVKMLVEYIIQTIKTFGFKKLIEISGTDAMDSLWRKYRILEFRLAEMKKDIGHGFMKQLKETVRRQILRDYGINPRAKFSVIGLAA